MIRTLFSAAMVVASVTPALAGSHASQASAQLGPRPFYLVERMDEGPLKDQLMACAGGPFVKSDWSIGHRGAALQFPEHTRESYTAAAQMGAGIVECDVTFTKDKELVCRHAQNDLATTTNILGSDLASSCVKPFVAATAAQPASADGKTAAVEAVPASAQCRTSELTLAEFKSLHGKMDAANNMAVDVKGFMDGTAGFRTDLYATKGTLMTHKESIALLKSLDVKFTPELKSASVEMPFEGFTQEMYAQKMIDEYKEAGVDPSMVFPQSFNLNDVVYWIKNEPEFGKQAVFLDDRYETATLNPMDNATFKPSMQELKDMGVNYIAPPLWMLVTLSDDGKIVPSVYTEEAKKAGLKIISWTAERSGLLSEGGGGWYYQSISKAIDGEGDVFNLMHVLDKQVGIVGLFSDWPATTTYYANCLGLE